MDLREFKEKYLRTEENQLGINTTVINRIIEFIESSKENSDESVKFFLDNFDKMDKVYENFNIFESDSMNGFMYHFQALNLTRDVDNYVIGHEIGHILNGIKNVRFVDPEHSIRTQVIVPNGFEKIINNAKANCLLPENKEAFKEYIQHLCKDQDVSKAEKGPLSDIFAAVFRQPALRIGSYENICVFPSGHREFYDEKIPKEEGLQYIFDECFANFFDLKTNNSAHELGVITKLLGNEFMQLFENEIEKAVEVFKREIEPAKILTAEKLGKETLEEQKDVGYVLESQKLLSTEPEKKVDPQEIESK